jgi:hypothetical protein
MVAVLAVACTSSASGATQVGELGNGTFDYYCAGVTDPVCTGGAPATNFPDCLMVGGEFEMGYTAHDLDELTDWGYEFVYVRPASSAWFGGNDTLTALRVGNAAFIAYADDNVIDLLHVDIVAPDGITLRDPETGELTERFEIEVGQTATIEAYASSSTCGQAGGAVPAVVTSADTSIATASDITGVQITGQAEGTTTLTVQMGDVTRELEIIVGPATITLTEPATDSITPDTDVTETGTDTGTGTETGTDASTDTGTDTGTETGTESGESGTDDTGSSSGTGA